MSQHTFYRKYRPNTFDEIVGQTHIVDTLKNAITNDRLTHAYIFSGPRGTGKTSVARILAKSLNCREKLGVSPCLTCDICQHITNGTSVDIVEIDAASNTGVDNIRSLNDTVNFSPVECRYKLYIIDEAHMLSTGAFNALLKTLEEPPENTIFILATTEPHKIPITIHSRCQHLHFRNLTIDEITSQLQFVSQSESLAVDPKGLSLIAKNSGGCMRDGLSLLNQAYSFKGSSISYDDVLFVLGTTEDRTLVQLLDHVLSYNHKIVIETLQQLIQSGANSAQLLSDLIRISTQLVHTALGLTDLVDGTPDYHSDLQSICKKTTHSILTQLLAKLADIEGEMRWFSYPSLLLQIRLVDFMTQHDPNMKPQTNPLTTATPPPVDDVPTHSALDHSPSQSTQKVSRTTPSKQPPKLEMSIKPPTPAPPSIPKTDTPPPQKSIVQSTEKIWLSVLDDIKKQNTALYALLRGSTVVSEDKTTLYIKLKQAFKFFIDKLSESHHQDTINTHLANHFTPPKQFKLYEGTAPSESSPPSDHAETVSLDSEKSSPPPASDSSDIQRINQVVKLFEGTIV